MPPTTLPSADGAPASTTPAGLQDAATLAMRRRLVLAANAVTWLALVGAAGVVLGNGGWTSVDVLLLVCFALGTPWAVLGFWNAVIGLWLLHGRKDALAAVAPYAVGIGDEPIAVRTAVFMTLRNEDPERAVLRLGAMKQAVDATGHGAMFDWFLLSDTDDAEIARREEEAARLWRERSEGTSRILYRRRTDNRGFKAGNVRDFCERWGGDYELMLPLDADSMMTAEAVLRLVRIMQRHPRLGILQSLVVGMPSRSAFARLFQFGMRHGMRAYTMGQSWWTADCGPFWGHNAVVRIAPFRDACDLPVLPGPPPLGGHVMSHDQVEATLMRRAGFEVRVLPEERGSYEENPPTILEFSKRDLRWCLGNLQYLKLLDLPGLLPMSRFQLVWAVLMFVSVPGWTIGLALLPFKLVDGDDFTRFPTGLAVTVYLAYFLMYLAPKIAGFLDILLTPGGTERYGGTRNFLRSAAAELAFSFLLGAVTTFRVTVFMIGLVFGRSRIAWSGQARDAHGVSWRTAFDGLWPVTAFGLAIMLPLAIGMPVVLLFSLPLTLGYLTAIPFAVLLSDERVGMRTVRSGLGAIPEDLAPPPELRTVQDAARARETERRAADAVAVARSVVTYHGDAAKAAAMDALLGRFVRPGDLVFDVGAHVGDRVAAFRRLGARVVAVEPQPGPADAIDRLFWDDPAVTLRRVAAAAVEGPVTLRVNRRNPTVSSASPEFLRAAVGAPGWEGQAWDGMLVVPGLTLDRLAAEHGAPDFVKIDVEGFELAVLGGLGRAPPALSFEFTTIQKDVALACLDRLQRLGDYRFDYALGESHALALGRWVRKDDIAAAISALPQAANSGDVYATLAGRATASG